MRIGYTALACTILGGFWATATSGCSSADPSTLLPGQETTSEDLRTHCRQRDPAYQARCASTCTPWGDDDKDGGDKDNDDGGNGHSMRGCDGGVWNKPDASAHDATAHPPPPPPPATDAGATPPPPATDAGGASAPPPTCTSFTYSAWGACQSNNTQTRTVTSSSPAGCTGGNPVLSQSCTYIDGAALYNQYCSGCHGTSKKGSSASAIQNAINSNTGGMGSLSNLTPAQIAAIAAAP